MDTRRRDKKLKVTAKDRDGKHGSSKEANASRSKAAVVWPTVPPPPPPRSDPSSFPAASAATPAPAAADTKPAPSVAPPHKAHATVPPSDIIRGLHTAEQIVDLQTRPSAAAIDSALREHRPIDKRAAESAKNFVPPQPPSPKSRPPSPRKAEERGAEDTSIFRQLCRTFVGHSSSKYLSEKYLETTAMECRKASREFRVADGRIRKDLCARFQIQFLRESSGLSLARKHLAMAATINKILLLTMDDAAEIVGSLCAKSKCSHVLQSALGEAAGVLHAETFEVCQTLAKDDGSYVGKDDEWVAHRFRLAFSKAARNTLEAILHILQHRSQADERTLQDFKPSAVLVKRKGTTSFLQDLRYRAQCIVLLASKIRCEYDGPVQMPVLREVTNFQCKSLEGKARESMINNSLKIMQEVWNQMVRDGCDTTNDVNQVATFPQFAFFTFPNKPVY